MPPDQVLAAALEHMRNLGVHVDAVSDFYDTACFPAGAGPDYVNAAARLRHPSAPGAFLELLHGVERAFGRERRERWGRRTLDLDIVAAGHLVLPDLATWRRWQALDAAQAGRETPGGLILPHPRLAERAFVLIPLADVAPGWTHPVTGDSVAEMLRNLSPEARAEVRARQPRRSAGDPT